MSKMMMTASKRRKSIPFDVTHRGETYSRKRSGFGGLYADEAGAEARAVELRGRGHTVVVRSFPPDRFLCVRTAWGVFSKTA